MERRGGAPPHVHVWVVSLCGGGDQVVHEAEALLAPDEIERANRFRVPAPRRSFVLTRACLRRVIGEWLDRDPREVVLAAGEHGKLYVDGGGVEFNVSHSGDVALLAVTRGGRLGVDVERIDESPDIDTLSRRFFSPAEADALAALSPRDRRVAFFVCWTRKEALLKATGRGLSVPLRDVETGVSRSLPVRRLRVPGEPTAWTIWDLDAPEGYAAAIAVAEEAGEIRTHRVDASGLLRGPVGAE
ncbi:MAG TPA: 4'-phosphopantetheinyl transferase superfamily protein [Actinomycetota bacterium]|nr:4'-phosphopantetheinyl transferase superfamily protein [Actinomycetota bacterium]